MQYHQEQGQKHGDEEEHGRNFVADNGVSTTNICHNDGERKEVVSSIKADYSSWKGTDNYNIAKNRLQQKRERK